jgi:hypothetical protein
LGKNKNLGIDVDWIAKPDSVLCEDSVNEERKFRSKASAFIEDVVPDVSVTLKIDTEDFLDGISEHRELWAGNVMLNQG